MVRGSAAYSLVEFGNKAIKPLKRRFEKENKMVSKLAIAVALTKLQEDDYFELIIGAAKSKGRLVKFAVIRASEELEDTHGQKFKKFFKNNLNLFPHHTMQERIFKYCGVDQRESGTGGCDGERGGGESRGDQKQRGADGEIADGAECV